MADPGEVRNDNIHRNTPVWIVDLVRQFFGGEIGLDPCSNATSLVRARVEWRGTGPRDDGLRLSWARKGGVFENPPYGDAIGDWMQKARREASRGVEIVALVPARTDTRWWAGAGADAICSLKGRLVFPPLKDPAKFPSAILYWGKRVAELVELFAPYCTTTSPRARKPQLELAPKRGEKPLAVLYHRASTDEQDATLAIDELERAALERGYDVRPVHRIVETGSGANNDRPGLQQVLDLARSNQVKAVLVWKVDRFARSTFDLLGNVRVLNDAGVRFVATDQGIDIGAGGDPVSRLMLTLLAGVAEFERSIIVDRTRLGMKKAEQRGKVIGRPSTITDEDVARVRELVGAPGGIGQRRLAAQLRWPRAKVRRALLLVDKAQP
jgi:putative DNA-invertase from lambdoid prophage Rac